MKVAIISEHASPLALTGSVDSGGQNVYVANIARQLMRAGHRVDVFTRRDRALLPTVSKMDGKIRVIHVPAGPAKQIAKEALLPYMDEFAAFVIDFFQRRVAAGEPYDVVHANFFMSGLVGLKVKDALDVPLVVTFHALGRVRRLHQGSADGFPDERFAIEDELVRRADTIVAECPQDRDDLVGLYGTSPERVDIVPCGFDSSEFRPLERRAARRALGWPADEFAVLQLGRLVPRKGIDNVIRGIGRLRQRYGVRAHLYIVGGNSDTPNELATPEIARLRGIAADAGVLDATTFVGRRGRAQLRFFYAASDVFVTTPWYEPFGITPVEAMACGTPVIGADVGGIRSTLVEGVTGLLVPPHDPDALATRLHTLYRDPALRQRLGAAGVARANACYTWAGVAQSLAQVYARVARIPQRAPELAPPLQAAGGAALS
jgi:glycosyltransferase involved in cell wall biosynthesis